MVGVDDNEIHEYINSSDSRFKPCISKIEEIYKLRGSRTRDFSDKITEILQAHLGNHWLWSKHDYTGAFIKINSVLGAHPADAFIHIVIASESLNNEFETFKSQFNSWGDTTIKKWGDLLDKSSRWTRYSSCKGKVQFKPLIIGITVGSSYHLCITDS